ncbi:MAG: CoA-acylating methylmalonate-semialdehyde dehydrogenase [Gammaproteobacteria bacterium]|nr:CoA-acylating methylmalonate-semialdehyde dehydrogenase [Gammaproteobacteria bacterium]|tara:strand:+ start:1835 stop:3337 length:1503 start_codon:yes stop_codon:yes gene_type:complete
MEQKVIEHWINGTHEPSSSNRYGDIYNPATGQVIAKLPMGNSGDLDKAVNAAELAFKSWSKTSITRRSQVLFKYKELLESNREELTRLITLEHGKVLSDAAGSLQRGIEVVDFACGIPHLMKGEFSEQVGTGIDCYSTRQPIGVCSGVTPFNFPAMVPMWMFPIAIVCGNTFILKPSEKNPSCSMKLAELMQEAGLPEGVMNVVHGDKEMVDAILDHPTIKTFSFVGSTPVAKAVHSKASANGKRVQALGGAKNHAIILADADIEQAANAIIGAAYGSAGERCMAISVVVALESIADELKTNLLEKASQLQIGPGDDPHNEMGPLITAEHKDKVINYIDQGVESGATLLLDGREHPMTSSNEGFFLGPTLFDHVQRDMSIYLEEIFGPVLVMLRVQNFSEAIELANQHQFGNGVALFTTKGSAAREFVNSVQVGMVGINVAIPVPLSFYTFGGWKDSIYGSSNIYGMDGVRFYTKTKTVTTRWPDIDEDEDLNLSMPTVK